MVSQFGYVPGFLQRQVEVQTQPTQYEGITIDTMNNNLHCTLTQRNSQT